MWKMKAVLEAMSHIETTLPGSTERMTAIGDMSNAAWTIMALTPLVAVATYGAWYIGQKLANRCMRDLRDRMLAHLVRLDLGFHSKLARGDLIARMTADLNNLLTLQTNLFGRLVQRPAEALGWIGFLFWSNWVFAVAVFFVLVPIGAVIAPILRKTRKRSQRARETYADNLNAFEQITAGIRVIKAMGSTEREVVRYGVTNQAYFDDSMRVARARAQSETVTQSSLFLLSGLALLIGAWLFTKDWITPAELLAAFMAIGRLTTTLREVQRVWGDTVEQFPAAERVFAVLDTSSPIVDKNDAQECGVPRQAITIEGVRFRYGPDADEVLRGIDLTIPVGKTVALVGESGSGKSTLLDLIPRFHDVTSGAIRVDGVDVRDVRQDSWVHHCAIVAQDSFLFNDTVFNNIRYGRPEATRAEVEQAATRAHVHEAILSLEGGLGYDTPVGDRGGRLSGGQRQRIAIARALLRDAPVLLLDEPTSALDADSERHVQAALAELMQGRTVIVVAHRLATIQHADVICVLAGKDDPRRGTIIERGSHRELVDAGGEYARLVKLQQLAG
jgi:ABC-type multidrug transport system fused ATPase/permease subunit